MSNYKTETIASELVSVLPLRTALPASWAYASGIPTVTLGLTALMAGGGATIQIKDQRNEVDAGFRALPGFNAVQQPVYTTGVAKVIVESQGDPSAALVAASGTLTLGNALNAPFLAGGTLTIAGVVLTEGVDFAAGATDDTSATAIAAAINAHPTLSVLVTAVATLGGAGNSTVTVTADMAGQAGNAITTVTNAGAVAVWGAATLVGGSGGAYSTVMPTTTFMKVWGELAKRGLKLELWETIHNTAPTAAATSYLVAEFWPSDYWMITSLV